MVPLACTIQGTPLVRRWQILRDDSSCTGAVLELVTGAACNVQKATSSAKPISPCTSHVLYIRRVYESVNIQMV